MCVKVFLDEPCKLYTADIQSAFMHLSSGRKENEVSYLNRRDKDVVLDNTGYYARPNDMSRPRKTILDPIGIKDINLTLVIPKLVRLFIFIFFLKLNKNWISKWSYIIGCHCWFWSESFVCRCKSLLWCHQTHTKANSVHSAGERHNLVASGHENLRNKYSKWQACIQRVRVWSGAESFAARHLHNYLH